MPNESPVSVAQKRLRSVALERALRSLDLMNSEAKATVLEEGEHFTLYVLEDGIIHRLRGEQDAEPRPEHGAKSACDYSALSITSAAEFSLTITAAGPNDVPPKHAWTFQLADGDEPLTFSGDAPPGVELPPDNQLVFAGALARAVGERAKAETLRP